MRQAVRDLGCALRIIELTEFESATRSSKVPCAADRNNVPGPRALHVNVNTGIRRDILNGSEPVLERNIQWIGLRIIPARDPCGGRTERIGCAFLLKQLDQAIHVHTLDSAVDGVNQGIRNALEHTIGCILIEPEITADENRRKDQNEAEPDLDPQAYVPSCSLIYSEIHSFLLKRYWNRVQCGLNLRMTHGKSIVIDQESQHKICGQFAGICGHSGLRIWQEPQPSD